MLNPSQPTSMPLRWPHWLDNRLKAVWEAALYRLHPPAILRPVAESKPGRLTVRASVPPGQTQVVCLAVEGELNRHTYTQLIDTACAHYHQGRCNLLLDLRQTTQLELSGLFALMSIARLYSGQPLLDPEQGWSELRQAAESISPALGERVKLIAPSPAAVAALERASFCRFFAPYADWETALAAFPLE